MAEIRGARTTNRDTRRTAPQRTTRTSSRTRRVSRAQPAPSWNQSIARLTGANNARGIKQSDYAAPKASPFGSFLDLFRRNTPAYGGTYNPTATNPAFNTNALTRAVQNAFGTRAPAYGGTYNPTSTNPAWPGNITDISKTAQRAPLTPVPWGYPVPDVSKTIVERYMDWINSVGNSALGYQTPYFPAVGSQQTSGGGGGGYGGYGGGGGRGGYGGAGTGNYADWLRGLLTRWNYS